MKILPTLLLFISFINCNYLAETNTNRQNLTPISLEACKSSLKSGIEKIECRIEPTHNQIARENVDPSQQLFKRADRQVPNNNNHKGHETYKRCPACKDALQEHEDKTKDVFNVNDKDRVKNRDGHSLGRFHTCKHTRCIRTTNEHSIARVEFKRRMKLKKENRKLSDLRIAAELEQFKKGKNPIQIPINPMAIDALLNEENEEDISNPDSDEPGITDSING